MRGFAKGDKFAKEQSVANDTNELTLGFSTTYKAMAHELPPA